MEQSFKVGDSVILRPGERYEMLNLDMSGWRGRVVGVDDDGDLLIAWDSQTMAEMPETAVARWVAEETDWSCMYVEPEALLPFEARDQIGDALAVARQRTAVYGVDFDLVSDNPLYADLLEFDDWDEEEEEDYFERPGYFDLDQFLYGLEIPNKEHPRIRRAFSQGLGDFYHDIYGYYKYGKQPADHIPERMTEPFVFGYGALAVLQHKSIGDETKLKIVQYALAVMEPDAEDGLPYGLITLVGYLAKAGALPLSLFHYAMLAQEFGGIGVFRRSMWHFGVQREAALALLDWLIAEPETAEDEKLFWAFRWSLQSEMDPHLVKALANHWLAHDQVSAAAKEEMCWAWLRGRNEAGTPPATWKLMSGVMSGDVSQVQQMLQEMGVAQSDIPIPVMAEPEDEMERMFMPGPHRFMLVPAPLKRIAIPALARLGQDPLTVVEMFWDGDYDYYIDAVYGGIADLLREFQAQIAPPALRQWVEKGLAHSRVNVRKTFHLLARDLYDGEYLPQALEDSAKSLRTWAAKQMKKRG